ncbi:MAG: DUF1302 domain-containing protein [Burkholderiales bacterium]
MDKAHKQPGKPMMRRLKPLIMTQACSMALAALSAGIVPQAGAEEFTLDNGDQGRWSGGVSLGDAWRTGNPDKALYSSPYGGMAGDNNQDGDLNYGKGAPISTPLIVNGEVQLKHDNLGFVLGARAWYDDAEKRGTVPVGSYNNGLVPNARLSDNGLYSLSKFSGATFTNAYMFGTFEPVEGKPLTVKVGDQVVNWGESLFIPGINQFGAFNYQALVTPGATIKDALLPIPQIDVNWGLGDGLSMEAFYQFTWVKSVASGCGTFWSVSDVYNCGAGAMGTLSGDSTGVNQYAQLNGLTPLNGLTSAIGMPSYHPNFGVVGLQDINAKESGQAGVSLHYFAPSISTDFGLYAAAYRQRLPNIDIVKIGNPNPQSLFSGTFNGLPPSALLGAVGGLVQSATAAKAAAAAAAAAGNAAAAAAYAAGAQQAAFAASTLGSLYPLVTPFSVAWDYSAPVIEEVGLSAATEVGGWSVGGETSFTKGFPVQLNPVDMAVGDFMGNLPAALGPTGAFLKANAGPLARFASAPAGSILQGWDLHDKLQLQMNTSKVLSRVAGAESLTLVGEIGVEKWTGIGDPNVAGNLRYGRGFTYGYATNNAAICSALNSPNSNPAYCGTSGFFTSTAWGYRLLGELNYPNVIDGWSLKPRVFWSQDVHGYSADSYFSQDREVLGLSLRAEYNNKYYAQITYTTFNHDATYDVMHDRDNIAAVAGINF